MTDCYTELPENIFMFLKDFPSYSFLDVSFGALRLKFSSPLFFFLIFPFSFLLLSYTSRSADLIFAMRGVYEQD